MSTPTTTNKVKLREIEYWISWLTSSFMPGGDWPSRYLGPGFDYRGSELYREDPDISRIDWGASLTEGELIVSTFSEERSIMVYLLGNLCPTMAFGSSQAKLERLALIAALISFSAFRKKDYFRFIGYTDEVVEFRFPNPWGRSYPFWLAEAILDFEWRGKQRGGLRRAAKRVPSSQRAIVLIVSDFFGLGPGFEKALRLLCPRHDVIPIVLWDPRELELPSLPESLPKWLRWLFQRLPWPLPLRDLETGELKYVFLNERTREAHRRNVEKQRRAIQAAFQCFGITPYFFTEVKRGDLEELVSLFIRRRRQH